MSEPDEKGCGDGDKGSEPTDLGGFSEFDERRCDEGDYGRTYAFESCFYGRYLFPILKNHRDSEDDEERRQYGSQDRAAHAAPTAYAPTDEDGGVDGYQARGRLRQGDHIQKFIFVDPALSVHYLTLDKG
jgi:hypothetical protein